jgi:cell wall-associated NlpC family hydrolase
MTFDGISAVQARIQEIDQIIASKAQGTSSASSSSSSPAATDAANSSDFAALLATEMDNGSGSSDPLSTTTSSSNNNIVSQLSQLSQLTNAANASATTAGGSKVAQQFLSTALSQAGKPYVWGASASPTDPNPKAFDCSELTKWAAARVGVTIPDVASAQYLSLRDHNALIPVDQALHTPGALLFHFDHEPKSGADSSGHVAISVGDGIHTIEARGHAYGTNVFDNAAGRGFNYAGVIPGMG